MTRSTLTGFLKMPRRKETSEALYSFIRTLNSFPLYGKTPLCKRIITKLLTLGADPYYVGYYEGLEGILAKLSDLFAIISNEIDAHDIVKMMIDFSSNSNETDYAKFILNNCFVVRSATKTLQISLDFVQNGVRDEMPMIFSLFRITGFRTQAEKYKMLI